MTKWTSDMTQQEVWNPEHGYRGTCTYDIWIQKDILRTDAMSKRPLRKGIMTCDITKDTYLT